MSASNTPFCFFFIVQNSFGARQRFHHQVIYFDSGAAYALCQILDRIDRRGNDMCLNIEAETMHPHRVPHPVMAIDRISAGYDMKQLPVS
jgi:hypothetical protein